MVASPISKSIYFVKAQLLEIKAIENAATRLMEFFGKEPEVMKLQSFIDQDPSWNEGLDMGHLMRVITCLTQSGLLTDYGGVGQDRFYHCRSFNQTYADYEAYENIVGGPKEIFRRHSGSVLPVIVTDRHENLDIGTGFYLGTKNHLITARHVVEKKVAIQIGGKGFQQPEIKNVLFHSDPKVDLALLETVDVSETSIIPFRARDGEVGDDIICIGFPPIPGFDGLRVMEHGEIAAELKVLKGEIVSSGSSYLDAKEYLLINARVKGGSSGGPVLDQFGFVVGVVASTALDAKSSDRLEGLGYGIVTPKSQFNDLMATAGI